jgi:hypothetical protein
MKFDRCCGLIDKRLRRSWLKICGAGSIVFVVRWRERVLRSKRAFFVMSTEAETSLTISLVNGALLRLFAFTLA